MERRPPAGTAARQRSERRVPPLGQKRGDGLERRPPAGTAARQRSEGAYRRLSRSAGTAWNAGLRPAPLRGSAAKGAVLLSPVAQSGRRTTAQIRAIRDWRGVRHSSRQSAASSALVSRSRACRPEAGVPSRPRQLRRRLIRALVVRPRLLFTATGGRSVPPSTPRHGDQSPRVTRNRHPRHQVAPPWGALRAVSMRHTG